MDIIDSSEIADVPIDLESQGQSNAVDQDNSAIDVEGTEEPARPPLVLDLRPPPLIPRSVVPDFLYVTLNGRCVGQLNLHDHVDLRHIINTSYATYLPATLTINSEQLGWSVATPLASQTLVTEDTSTPEIGPSTPKERQKRAASCNRPLASKDVNFYAKAMTEPEGMTKEESDTRLTSLCLDRRCKGTTLVMVNGTKRCQTCAHPGTGTSSRICYNRNPE